LIEERDCELLHIDKEIKDTCLRLLARREHSQNELLNKLALRGFGADDARPVIDELAEQGWQSDLRYAENYARFRILKGYGPIRVNYELKQNGITAFDVEDIVQDEVGSWMELLEQVYRKKYTCDTVLNRNEWAKRSRFLLHRGFSGEMISALFDHLAIKLK
jgi:regulatory protein